MTTKRLNHAIHMQWKTALENSVYTALSALLIGQVFFVHGMVSYTNAFLVLLGVMFGILAIYRLTPINNWVAGKDVTEPAEILYFSVTDRKIPAHRYTSDDHTRHAA